MIRHGKYIDYDPCVIDSEAANYLILFEILCGEFLFHIVTLISVECQHDIGSLRSLLHRPLCPFEISDHI